VGSAVNAVVVNYRASDELVDCVRSLHANGVTDVVVADNGDDGGLTAALGLLDPAPTVVATGANLGFGAAANRGVAATTAEFVAVMNPDVIVGDGAIKALVDVLASRPDVAVVGPRVDNRDGSLYPSVRTFPAFGDAVGHAFLGFVAPRNRFTRRYRMLDWDHDAPADVDWVSGTFLLARRAALDAVGGFDEGYFMYVEDVDLCRRCWDAGFRVAYEPAARVTHTIGVSSERMPYRMIAAHHRSLWRYSRRTERGWRRVLLPPVGAGLVVRTALAWLQRALRRRPPAAL
jgi:N-acetylglucosaminyl-diphospho-decaprenol L-rhamnosyltransferase